MAQRQARSRARRFGAAAVACALHLGAFWLILAGRTEDAVPFEIGAINVALLSGPVPGAAAASPAPPAARAQETRQEEAEQLEPPPERPPEPPPTAEAPLAIPTEPIPPPTTSDEVLEAVRRMVGADSAAAVAQAAPTAADAALSPAGGGMKCEAGGAVLEEVLHDPDALSALAALPRTSLSVSGAIQLWDGQAWVDETTVGGVGATLPIRKAVARALENAPPECLQMPFAGPRFLIIPLVDRPPVIVVIGSGEWTWAQALAQSGLALQPRSAPSAFAPF